ADSTDIFHETFSHKPPRNVPPATQPIAIDGDLSDFPASSRLQGLREAPVVGAERFHEPLPNIHLAWSNEGLYVGLEVFNSTPLPARSGSNWQTGDCIELYLST